MLDTVTRADKLIEREQLTGAVEASLHFSHGGGRTVLARQRVPYPFHATRTFYLDQARPDLATLYLQSAAGGLYRGDRVALSITADPHSAAHVTTQAATIVHRTHRFPIEQSTRLEVGEHAFLALTPDPLVLFPGAEISCATEITLAASGCAILTDGLSHHDPEGLVQKVLVQKVLAARSSAIATQSSCAMPPAVFCSTTAARSQAKRCLLRRRRSAPIAQSERFLCSAKAQNAAMRSFLTSGSPQPAAWRDFRSCRTTPGSAAACSPPMAARWRAGWKPPSRSPSRR